MFLFQNLPGTVLAASHGGEGGAASACSGGFSRAAPGPSLTPHGPPGRTPRLGRCASRSRSQSHAQPRRGVPPAAGVTAARGVPLPAGDMA